MEVNYSKVFEFVAKVALSSIFSLQIYLVTKYLVKQLDVTNPDGDAIKKRAKLLLKMHGITDKVIGKLTPHELYTAANCLLRSPLDCKDFKGIAAQQHAIEKIKRDVLIPLTVAKSETTSAQIKALTNLHSPPKGILLYGPPGCGKTLLARALAADSGYRFLNVDISTLTDKWYGESNKHVAGLFKLAQNIAPCIIFIDEIDSLLNKREDHQHEADAQIKTQFMTHWDGLHTLSTEEPVILIGATNKETSLDAAILRRMPLKIRVPFPDNEGRYELFKLFLSKTKVCDGVDLRAVARDCPKETSGADIQEICRSAAHNAVGRMLACQSDEQVTVTADDFESAMKDMFVPRVTTEFPLE